MNILTCEGVSKVYGSGDSRVVALAGVDLKVDGRVCGGYGGVGLR